MNQIQSQISTYVLYLHIRYEMIFLIWINEQGGHRKPNEDQSSWKKKQFIIKFFCFICYTLVVSLKQNAY